MKDDFITANFKLATGQIQPLKIPLSEVDKYFTGPEGKEKLNEEAVLARLKERYPKIYQSHIDAEYSGYSQKYLSDDSGSIPAQLYRKYALAKDKQNFDFSTPTGKLSTVGQRAIRRKYEEAQRGGIRKEQAANKGLQEAQSRYERSFPGMTGMEYAVAGENFDKPVQAWMRESVLPQANRRMTAAVTGQEASNALPLGLYPEGRLTPATGFGGTMKRAAGNMLTAEGMAGTAGAIAAAPAAASLVAAYPMLGVLGGAASLAPAAMDIAQGDFGGAAANAMLGIPGMAVSRPLRGAKEVGYMAKEAKHLLNLGLIPLEGAVQTRALKKDLDNINRYKQLERIFTESVPQEVAPPALTVADRIGNLKSQASELRQQSLVLRMQGRLKEANEAFRKSEEIDRTIAEMNL